MSKQEGIPVGSVPSAAVAISGEGGGVCPVGVSAQGGVCLGVVYTPRPRGRHPQTQRQTLPQTQRQTAHQTQRQTPSLGTEFLTHTCENITFPQLLLRTVMRKKSQIDVFPNQGHQL